MLAYRARIHITSALMAIAFSVSGRFNILISRLLSGTQARPRELDASITYIVSVLYLAVFGLVVAFGAYLTLPGRISAHRAGYATVMFPVVALMLSRIFSEPGLDQAIVLGTALVLFGELLILKEKQ